MEDLMEEFLEAVAEQRRQTRAQYDNDMANGKDLGFLMSLQMAEFGKIAAIIASDEEADEAEIIAQYRQAMKHLIVSAAITASLYEFIDDYSELLLAGHGQV